MLLRPGHIAAFSASDSMDREPGIRFLSLDAGGLGVYFQLRGPKELMVKVALDIETSEDVPPSAYFDLVASSGFGSGYKGSGWNAGVQSRGLLLGRSDI